MSECAVFAGLPDKVVVRVTDWMSYDDALREWQLLDDPRHFAQTVPGVNAPTFLGEPAQWFTVRATDDAAGVLDWRNLPTVSAIEAERARAEAVERAAAEKRARRRPRRKVEHGPFVPVRKIRAGEYVTLDGRYSIEHQDGITECGHPNCYDLHQRFHEYSGGGWMHWTTYVAWHIWDNELGDYLEHDNTEFDTKREAHQALTEYLREQT